MNFTDVLVVAEKGGDMIYIKRDEGSGFTTAQYILIMMARDYLTETHSEGFAT